VQHKTLEVSVLMLASPDPPAVFFVCMLYSWGMQIWSLQRCSIYLKYWRRVQENTKLELHTNLVTHKDLRGDHPREIMCISLLNLVCWPWKTPTSSVLIYGIPN
jgi:hypothetical protein